MLQATETTCGPTRWTGNSGHRSVQTARYRIAQTALATVPDQLFRQGNFSELLGANNFFNRTYSLKDASGNPIPGNIIPQSQLSKNGLALINAYPLPTA